MRSFIIALLLWFVTPALAWDYNGPRVGDEFTGEASSLLYSNICYVQESDTKKIQGDNEWSYQSQIAELKDEEGRKLYLLVTWRVQDGTMCSERYIGETAHSIEELRVRLGDDFYRIVVPTIVAGQKGLLRPNPLIGWKLLLSHHNDAPDDHFIKLVNELDDPNPSVRNKAHTQLELDHNIIQTLKLDNANLTPEQQARISDIKRRHGLSEVVIESLLNDQRYIMELIEVTGGKLRNLLCQHLLDITEDSVCERSTSTVISEALGASR